MVFKNLGGVLPAASEAAEDIVLLGKVTAHLDSMLPDFEAFRFSAAIESWMQAVFACNAYVDAMAPWTLRKTDPDRMSAVLGTLVAAIRPLAAAISPVVPSSAQKIIDLIDSGAGGVPIEQPAPIFPRLELEAEES
jgi:methionyl-tRNA synthetase